MPTYKASRVAADNTLFPDRIEIDSCNVTFYKGSFFGYSSKVISLSNIASTSISAGLLFATVTIESRGGEKIVASGFTRSDARAIIDLVRV